MSPRSFLLTDDLAAYVAGHVTSMDDVVASLIAETEALGPVSGMQIAVDQGRFLQLMATVTGARRAIEVGTFTGFSALCVARGMGSDGRLVCCDVNEEWTSIGRRHWEMAGVADQIELVLAPAAGTIAALPAEPTFDLAFIDADKPGYWTYLDLLHPRLVPGAVVLVDNTLWSGAVVQPADPGSDAAALQDFNDRVVADDRFESVILTIGDGLTMIRRK